MTESAYFAEQAQKDCFSDLGVERYQIEATLDGKTSEICRSMDQKVFFMSEWETAVTAPPFHPWCRTTTVPYFGDEEELGITEKRIARGEDGKTYEVPGDMSYRKWQAQFLDGGEKEGLQEVSDGAKMEQGEGMPMQLEDQRYGRNKDTVINHTYIESGEYRRKFDAITENASVCRTLYSTAKKMLRHRSGSAIEDMYWIDGDSGKILASVTDETAERGIRYSKIILDAIAKCRNVYTLHTHPSSMPPSVADFNSVIEHGYSRCFVVCHNGKIFEYSARETIRESLYNLYLSNYVEDGLDEYEAQIKTLDKLKNSYQIDYREVK